MSEPTVTSQEGQVQLLQSQESSSSAGSMNIAYRWEQGLFEMYQHHQQSEFCQRGWWRKQRQITRIVFEIIVDVQVVYNDSTLTTLVLWKNSVSESSSL